MAEQVPTPDRSPEPLLSLRTTFILSLALVVGVVVGALTLWIGAVPPAAALAGLAAFGGMTRGLHEIIGKG